MNPLLGKTFLRVLTFSAYGLFAGWIFTLIEKRDQSAYEREDMILKELRKGMNQKYSMTDNDFAHFVQITTQAVREGDELDWTFVNSCGFIFAALTTIGNL